MHRRYAWAEAGGAGRAEEGHVHFSPGSEKPAEMVQAEGVGDQEDVVPQPRKILADIMSDRSPRVLGHGVGEPTNPAIQC